MTNDVVRLSALERARQVQSALGEAMRRSRLSTRRRRSYDTGTFSRRRGARLWSAMFVANFVIVFLMPSVLSIVYFSFLASPQYVSESKFTVKGGDGFRPDGLGMMIGMPSAYVVQDTQIVANYIQSRAMVEKLQEKLDIRQMYGANDIDWFSRFDSDQPIEKLVEYWKTKVDVSIQLPGGIVTVTVKAFTANDTLQIAAAVLELSENLVNDNNRKMLADNLASSKLDFERAARRLGQSRLAIEKARNAEGMLSPTQAGQALADLVTELKSGQLKLQQDYGSQAKYVSTDAPQMRALNIRIRAMSAQIQELEGRMTSSSISTGADKPLSKAMTTFSSLELENRIAEKHYAATAKSLELARATADIRLVYLQAFLRPSLPEQPLYPKRLLSIVVVVFGSLFAWASMASLASMARNHMA